MVCYAAMKTEIIDVNCFFFQFKSHQPIVTRVKKLDDSANVHIMMRFLDIYMQFYNR